MRKWLLLTFSGLLFGCGMEAPGPERDGPASPEVAAPQGQPRTRSGLYSGFALLSAGRIGGFGGEVEVTGDTVWLRLTTLATQQVLDSVAVIRQRSQVVAKACGPGSDPDFAFRNASGTLVALVDSAASAGFEMPSRSWFLDTVQAQIREVPADSISCRRMGSDSWVG